ncbi:NADP dehydrogenase [ubiquinone] 1 alpha subcomplex assembly factor 3 [Plakobranchus ocellatus]|uniref:NADH dehydrogenase [ubiquinone] 1 alpha subcomplex assembly factor 3 n=1 Tax=Plakobranchus ocellatus TaxID=259542 RepID=A0AAV4BSJ1_9GAST|nr:NADP dehydrogenase [ubiquinone] 1 alpha subcomplex assembly factor 3 [Plakobranchus ocellatus]
MISRHFIRSLCNRKISRLSCISVRNHNFDGESYSKSSLSLITKEDETQNYIEAFSAYGFRLTSGFNILGPCALFPRAVLHWNVASSEKITPESLSLFCMLYPKLDILILGKGDWDAKVDNSIIKYLRSNRINTEILPTEQACSTFNFLNSEHRLVAAALIPPQNVDMPSSDQFFLHDERIPLPSEKELLDDHPEITRTMESFKKHGVYETIAEHEKSNRPQSWGPFGQQNAESKRDEPSGRRGDKPREE